MASVEKQRKPKSGVVVTKDELPTLEEERENNLYNTLQENEEEKSSNNESVEQHSSVVVDPLAIPKDYIFTPPPTTIEDDISNVQFKKDVAPLVQETRSEMEFSSLFENQTDNEKAEKFQVFSDEIHQGHCNLCRVAVNTQNGAYTVASCERRHLYHNHCAFTFIGSGCNSSCPLCQTKRIPMRSLVQSRTDTKGELEIASNRISFGDDVYIDESIESRACLFETMGEYKSAFTLATISFNLTVDDPMISNSGGAAGISSITNRSHSDDLLAMRNSFKGIAVANKILGVIKDTLDMDYEERQEKEMTILSHGHPLELIRKSSLTLSQLIKGGVNASSLLFHRIPISEWFKSGRTLENLVLLMVSREQLLALGFDDQVWAMYKKQINIHDLVRYYKFTYSMVVSHICGNSIMRFAKLRLTVHEHLALKTSFRILIGHSDFDFKCLRTFELNLAQMKALGLDANILIRIGAPVKQLIEQFKIDNEWFVKLFQMSLKEYEDRWTSYYHNADVRRSRTKVTSSFQTKK